MDFVYDPVQQAQLTAWVQYISPVKGVREEIAKIDPELADNPLLFPDDATAARLRSFATLDDETETAMDARFAEITGA
jgi:spermidine/putrescine transport system substrate-binding protein